MNAPSKVTAEQLQRSAYLYIRQSTLRQVLENTESTQRQYDLRQRAVGLGWPPERIVVIDHDQGQSGASAADRQGFQRLVAEVGLGKAGIVMGLEVSRLARNCADWHRLLEICGLTQTLILDEDGLYDPGHYNDRLLLGLKGTMSEAELHILKARMIGGVLSKAQRGELKLPLPIGLVYDQDQHVVLEPDVQVQQTLRLFFATFERTGSAWATVRAFGRQGWNFPKRGHPGTEQILWQPLTEGLALDALHNPRYAGVFCFGRTRSWKDAQGKHHSQWLPREQWRFVKQDAHPGYIRWEQFLAHQERLLQNRQRCGGGPRPAGPPREGPALLQGLVLCGKCGRSMTVRYHQQDGRLAPDYVCSERSAKTAEPLCQFIPGAGIDQAVGTLLVQSVTPLAMEVALQVQSEIQARLAEADRLRQQQVQRAQYEADRARVRYMCVDPNNRLVAATLETQWNEKLRLLRQAQEDYERERQRQAAQLTEEQKSKILALASDFPKLWQDPKTQDRERKRMARLLLEDVTLQRGSDILVQVRFRGGATRELRLPLPRSAWALRRTKPEIMVQLDQLIGQKTPAQIAADLNARGWHSSTGQPFTRWIIYRLRRSHHLHSRADRLRATGLITAHDMASLLGTKTRLVDYWRQVGLLKGTRFNDRNEYFYERPDPNTVQQIKQRIRWKPTRPLS